MDKETKRLIHALVDTKKFLNRVLNINEKKLESEVFKIKASAKVLLDKIEFAKKPPRGNPSIQLQVREEKQKISINRARKALFIGAVSMLGREARKSSSFIGPFLYKMRIVNLKNRPFDRFDIYRHEKAFYEMMKIKRILHDARRGGRPSKNNDPN